MSLGYLLRVHASAAHPETFAPRSTRRGAFLSPAPSTTDNIEPGRRGGQL